MLYSHENTNHYFAVIEFINMYPISYRLQVQQKALTKRTPY